MPWHVSVPEHETVVAASGGTAAFRVFEWPAAAWRLPTTGLLATTQWHHV